jgi:hypothetical protein
MKQDEKRNVSRYSYYVSYCDNISLRFHVIISPQIKAYKFPISKSPEPMLINTKCSRNKKCVNTSTEQYILNLLTGRRLQLQVPSSIRTRKYRVYYVHTPTVVFLPTNLYLEFDYSQLTQHSGIASRLDNHRALCWLSLLSSLTVFSVPSVILHGFRYNAVFFPIKYLLLRQQMSDFSAGLTKQATIFCWQPTVDMSTY